MLELKVTLPKERYTAGEDVSVGLILRNRSDHPVTVNARMGLNPGNMSDGTWEVRFDLTYPPGERLAMSTLINRGQPEKDDFQVLQPGGEVSKTYTLSDFFWMELPGEYAATAIYRNMCTGEEFGISAWTGEITSNPIQIYVE